MPMPMPMPTILAGPQRVTPAAWPVPEERRTVTVLFADIVGSTALVDRLDPEDVRALQRAYFDTVAGVLRRWHGVVEKYIGDAVMALFGARGSDGFDAYRAVRAALEIQRALDRRPLPGTPRLRVRVGVATGEALVDLAATRDGGHGAASGAVITTAARLQAYAPPGGVALCAATRRATEGLIEQRRVPPVALAGKALPVDVWHATGTARPAPTRHEGPLVGRRRELAAARDLVLRALRDRSPRWLSLVGPAGVGRSRLLHELRHAVAAVDDVPVRWCVAHCPPYPQALAPVADLVRGLAGLRADEPPATVRRRLAAAVAGLVPPGRLTGSVCALEELLSGPDASPGAARGAEVAREALLALAAREPLVVAVDDLDRATGELHRFLHRLFAAATARSLPLAVVAVHRPEWADVLPAGRRHRLDVPPLRPVETGRLLRHLLRRADRPAAQAARLLPLVDGNPGRATAYVATIGGAPPARLPVPDAVRREVDARLDRLDATRRAVLMAAATLDAGVTAPSVARLLGWTPDRALPALRALAASGLLVVRADGRYAVADPVLREVAYARLPRAVRATFALRAGLPAGALAPVPGAADREPTPQRDTAVVAARRRPRDRGPGGVTGRRDGADVRRPRDRGPDGVTRRRDGADVRWPGSQIRTAVPVTAVRVALAPPLSSTVPTAGSDGAAARLPALATRAAGHGLPAPGAGAGKATTRPLGCDRSGPPQFWPTTNRRGSRSRPSVPEKAPRSRSTVASTSPP
ncbi:adenylate/guanylate cyclase domain-containing protein [Micromonospora citrea]|nr:adenylate/guanylate cyclase domain-containing protein [Micromonospora citrea]